MSKLFGSITGAAAMIITALGGAALADERGPADPRELEVFLDGLISGYMDAADIPGVTVSVVKDGALLLAKGYGYADAQARTLVDPEKTLFRVGSISKIFMATAVMQQVEQGRLDLDADVNSYLIKFSVPDTYPEPITLEHIMTHTAGFEEAGPAQTIVESEEALEPLGDILAGGLPARVRPPGVLSAYSNHATALAGHIVELVSGLGYDDYIDQRILQPLGMDYTTSRQPVPERLAPYLSKGHTYSTGDFKPGKFEYVPIAPAGSVSSTAADMAKFMIAHLQFGRYGDARILKEETARRMQTRIFGHDPRVDGMAHQFFHQTVNGELVVQHGGNVARHHSAMYLLPERNVGFFISVNGGSGRNPSKMAQQFMDRYYPIEDFVVPEPPPGADERLAKVTGHYRMTRTGYTNITKLTNLFGMPNAAPAADGKLSFMGATWVETEPFVYHELFGPRELVFRTDEDGAVTHGFISDWVWTAFERVAWHEAPPLHLLVGIGSLLLFVSALVAWPVSAWRARKAGVKRPMEMRLARWVGAGAGLPLLFLIILLMALSSSLGRSVPTILIVALNLTYLMIPLSIAAVIFAVLAWRRGYWGRGGRIHYSLVALACAMSVWWLDYWNMLGVHF